MTSGNRWADLGPRTLSALVLLLTGGTAIHQGGAAFAAFVALATGAVFWEILRMFRVFPHRVDLAAIAIGGLAAALVFWAAYLPLWLVPLVLALPLGLGTALLAKDRRKRFALTGAWVLLGGFGLIWLRNEYWVMWITWVIFAVVATDVAGYFVGKYVGGKKLWPRVSPNKTWSGTIGGWGAAVLTGGIFVLFLRMPPDIIWISLFVSMFSQAGDITQSALKREAGIKDSSQLIPGHGGVFDRFDGMLGAGALCFLVAITWG